MVEDSASYDVVVIGAGPSGCLAAMKLARRFRVLLLERCAMPRRKSCSGVLIRKSVTLIESEIGPVPENVCCTPFRTSGLTIVTTSRSYDFLDAGVNVVRADFDYWLAEEASRRGVTLIDNAMVTGIERDGLSRVSFRHGGKTHVVTARLVVACDGVNGCFRRLVGLAPQRKVVTYQKFYKGRMNADPARFYAFTSPEFSSYDAWFNSKNGRIVVGSIAATRIEAEAFQRHFAAHLASEMRLEIEGESGAEVWTLPLVAPEPEITLSHAGVLFAGEAAGMLNPFGEGMSIGMTAAQTLAEACLAAPDIGDVEALARAYASSVAPELAYMCRQWGYLREISPEFCENVGRLRKPDGKCTSDVSPIRAISPSALVSTPLGN